MRIKLNRKLKVGKIYYFISVFLLIVTIIVTSVVVYNEFFYTKAVVETVSKNELEALELYGYSLDDHDTELYTELFNELKNILNEEEVDFQSYAEVLSKLFVVDVYTLNNKITSTDIGGLEFLHPDLIENFEINLGDNMYNTIISNVYGDRTQELPIVSEVDVIDIYESVYIYNEIEYNSYTVNLEWTYEEELDYEQNAELILIIDGSKLLIVEKDGE